MSPRAKELNVPSAALLRPCTFAHALTRRSMSAKRGSLAARALKALALKMALVLPMLTSQATSADCAPHVRRSSGLTLLHQYKSKRRSRSAHQQALAARPLKASALKVIFRLRMLSPHATPTDHASNLSNILQLTIAQP